MHFTQQGAVHRVDEQRICMNFMLHNGWHVSFLDADCRTYPPLELTFADADLQLIRGLRSRDERLAEQLRRRCCLPVARFC